MFGENDEFYTFVCVCESKHVLYSCSYLYCQSNKYLIVKSRFHIQSSIIYLLIIMKYDL